VDKSEGHTDKASHTQCTTDDRVSFHSACIPIVSSDKRLTTEMLIKVSVRRNSNKSKAKTNKMHAKKAKSSVDRESMAF
jgi:hypothetical protein